MAKVRLQRIQGHWNEGYSLDLHTNSSTFLGYDQNGTGIYDTDYTELGSLLYRFKYRMDHAAGSEIIATVVEAYYSKRNKFDLVVPVPPSKFRVSQPVMILAQGISNGLRIPFVECVSTMRPPNELKDVFDPGERRKLVDGLYAVNSQHTKEKRILLFDDLFRSGSTMNAVAEVLWRDGEARSISALTITRTRKNR